MAQEFDEEMLARSLDGLRLARISNEIEGVREHPEDTPLLEACVRGEISREELHERVLSNIQGRSKKAS